MVDDSDPVPRNDFPFYNGRPVRLSGSQWTIVMLAVALGFGALIAPVPAFASAMGQFIPAVLFFAIPLAALAWVAPSHWQPLFRKVAVRDVAWMFLIALLNIGVTISIGLWVSKTHGAQANPVFATMASEDTASRIVFFLRTIPQLFGEELVTILPMLGLMALFHGRLGLSRRTAIVLAWLLSAALFGALHLPTYGWDLVQCFVIIGSARLVLSLAYLKTKNIWVSTGAHIINDWALFGTSLLGAAVQAT